jgi:hypothetical protein
MEQRVNAVIRRNTIKSWYYLIISCVTYNICSAQNTDNLYVVKINVDNKNIIVTKTGVS